MRQRSRAKRLIVPCRSLEAVTDATGLALTDVTGLALTDVTGRALTSHTTLMTGL